MLTTVVERLEVAISRSSATWTHSSRVGTTTSTFTPGAGSRPMRWMIGRPKPKVLPVPVLAWPMMSWPLSARGMVCAWIGNGSTMPFAARASTMSWSMLSSEKVKRYACRSLRKVYALFVSQA